VSCPSATIVSVNMVELRTDVAGKQAVEALRQTEQDAGNARNGSQVLEAYLRWTEAAARTLGNVLTSDAVSDLIYTQHYWVLRAATADSPRLIAQVMAELDNRQRVLTETADRLDRERSRWQNSSASLVVPDTNMFLQDGKPLSQVDWTSVCGRAIEIRIVVPIMVIHELDRLKRQGNNTTRSMARQALRWLVQVLPYGLDGSSLLSSGTTDTRIEVYVHGGPSRPEDADSVIIQVVKRLAQLSELPTRLVTYDLGMRLRAMAAGVNAEQLLDE